MSKLTDTQFTILSTAAGRQDGHVLPLPEALKLKGANRQKVLDALLKKGLVEEHPCEDVDLARRKDGGLGLALVITNSGTAAALASEDENGDPKGAPGSRPIQSTAKKPRKTNAGKAPATAPTIKPNTKQAALIKMLERKQGATIPEIGNQIGWQAHSVRGAISGLVKKKLGLAVTSEVQDRRGRVYRISKRA